jgi:hypothetical protein
MNTQEVMDLRISVLLLSRRTGTNYLQRPPHDQDQATYFFFLKLLKPLKYGDPLKLNKNISDSIVKLYILTDTALNPC